MYNAATVIVTVKWSKGIVSILFFLLLFYYYFFIIIIVYTCYLLCLIYIYSCVAFVLLYTLITIVMVLNLCLCMRIRSAAYDVELQTELVKSPFRHK